MLLDIYMIVWLFPIIFILHDFEEIIFIKPWFEKNRERLTVRFPKMSKRLLAHTDSFTTSSLALGVAGMFMLISVVTITAYMTDWYYLWFGVFIAFTFHLIIHCFPGFVFMGYVPAIVTSVIFLPLCCYINVLFLRLVKIDFILAVLFTAIGIAIMAANLLLVHKVMPIFDRWLNGYQYK